PELRSMIRVNLLPWREIRRKEEDRELLVMAGGAWFVVAMIVVYAHLHVRALVSDQKQRNQFLQQQIALVNSQIGQIATIKKQRADLITRMKIITKLQESREQMVHVFDDLVREMPPGMYLTSIQQGGAILTISGVAQSNARVSAFLRHLDHSRWFANPNLDVINVVRQNGARVSKFKLLVSIADKKPKEASGKKP
ncbi:MAG: PilN domain-containing protein, partial [Acidiferrobacteraceae bacterium]